MSNRLDAVTGQNFRQVKRDLSPEFIKSIEAQGINIDWWVLWSMGRPATERVEPHDGDDYILD